MNSSNPEDNFNMGNLPLDKLERDILPPPLEVAEAEYFADMAFDERLDYLLENEPSSISLSIHHTTSGITERTLGGFFTLNATEKHDVVLSDDLIEEMEVPAFSYFLSGVLEQHHGRIIIDAFITPDDDKSKNIRIESTPHSVDTFCVSRRGENSDLALIDTRDLFSLLCQLNGATQQDVERLFEALDGMNQNILPVLKANIEAVWTQLGESHGRVTRVRELSHQVKNPAIEQFPERIRLRHELEETESMTYTKFFLEHTTEMTPLDVEDTYCLTLVFEQATSRTTEKNAERIVASGTSPRMVALDIERKSKGRVTKLDLDATSIKELFVNWFDQLISN